MAKNSKKIELLAPAGSLEKLEYALHFGADAVYAGVPEVSMRARINAFTEESLAKATSYVHARGKKIFVTLNIYAHNYHLPAVERHLKYLKKIAVDGIIVSDPGIIMLAKKYLPEVEIHLSTQVNTTNWQAAKFWYELGVKRVVLARETTLDDIRLIHKKVPKLELEYFVHGAMCMSYSGRCILSKWMSGKSANLGDCSQPCRWPYNRKGEVDCAKFYEQQDETSQDPENRILTMRVEDARKEHEVGLEEDSQGTYFFNSKDLNLLRYLRQLREAGVNSFKIEGRNKSVFYVATVVRAYRQVLDAIENGLSPREIAKITRKSAKELDTLVNRGYTAGFLMGNEPEHGFDMSHEESAYRFSGEIIRTDGKVLKTKIHNALYVGDRVEIMGKSKIWKTTIKKIYDEDMQNVGSAHGGQDKLYYLQTNKDGIEPMSLVRKVLDKKEN